MARRGGVGAAPHPRGRTAKVVLARTVAVESDHPLDVLWLLRRLAAREPDRYLFATPDIVGRIARAARASGTVESCAAVRSPVRARRRTPSIAALAASAKDRHEHSFVVDAVADDPAGAVHRRAGRRHRDRRTRRPRAPRHPDASGGARHHPVARSGSRSRCTRRRRSRGRPGPAAMRYIREHEPDRGRYAGPVGWVDAGGNGSSPSRCEAEIDGPDRRHGRSGPAPASWPAATPAAEWARDRSQAQAGPAGARAEALSASGDRVPEFRWCATLRGRSVRTRTIRTPPASMAAAHRGRESHRRRRPRPTGTRGPPPAREVDGLRACRTASRSARAASAWGRNEKMPPPPLSTTTNTASSPRSAAPSSPLVSCRKQRSPDSATVGAVGAPRRCRARSTRSRRCR